MKVLFFSFALLIAGLFVISSCSSFSPKKIACELSADLAFNECMGDATSSAKKVGCNVVRRRSMNKCMR